MARAPREGHARLATRGRLALVPAWAIHETQAQINLRPLHIIIDPHAASVLAQAVLAVHMAIAAFIVLGTIAIPLGARFGWVIVRMFWWRLAHLIAMGAVALQKLLGDSCFLSVWERHLVDIASEIPHRPPTFQSFGEHVLYWNLPLWFLSVLYSLMFVFVAIMWFVVPPRQKRTI